MANTEGIRRAKQSLRIAEVSREIARAAVRRAEEALSLEEAKVRKYLDQLASLGVSSEEICDLGRTP
jgi:hypothetical protein